MERLRQVYLNPRVGTLLFLGFASGLPLSLTDDTLKAWMSAADVDLATIGLFGLVGWPYVVKVLWAPVVDRYVPPILGRRRGWIFLSQLMLIGGIAAMAFTGPDRSLYLLGGIALAVALFSATQDIAVDAYRTDVLPPEERGAGAAVFVTGYRLALLLAASGALILVGRFNFSWSSVYLLMAGAMLIGVIATFVAPEPIYPAAPPATLAEAVIDPLREFLLRPGGILVMIFVALFKLPDAMAGAMTVPFLLKGMKFSPEIVGTVRQAMGMGITIVGALIGGGIVARIGLWRSLWIFGILQALSNVGFWILTQSGARLDVLIGVIAVENFCGGLTTAGFIAFLMSQCDHRFSATQYALLSSLMALTRVVGGTPTGYLANRFGWSTFFLLTIVAAIPAMLLLPWLKIRIAAAENPQESAPLFPSPFGRGQGEGD